MNLNSKISFAILAFIIILPLSTADDTNNFKSDNLVNQFTSVTQVTNITNNNITQSVNVSVCNPANQALGNWNGTGWECVSISDDDSGYLTIESDPVAMTNISLNFNNWILWSLDKPNYLLKSELNSTFDRNHANETNLEWSKSGHTIDTNLDINFYPLDNVSEFRPYNSTTEFGLYEQILPNYIAFIDHQLVLDTVIFLIEPTSVSLFKDLDMNGHNILNSPSLNDNDSAYLTILNYTTDYDNQQINNSNQEILIQKIRNNETAYIGVGVDGLTNYYNKTTSDERYLHGALVYYFHNVSSGISNYFIMNTTVPQTANMLITNFTSVNDGDLLLGRINPNTNISAIEAGLWSQHTHVQMTNGGEAKNLQMRSVIYKRLLDGTEILLSNSSISNIIPNDGTMHDTIWFGQFSQKEFLNNTDMILMKLYAVVTGVGAAPSFQIHIEGTTGASIILPVNPQSISVSANDTIARQSIIGLQNNDTSDRLYVNNTFLPISTYNGNFPNTSLGNYYLNSNPFNFYNASNPQPDNDPFEPSCAPNCQNQTAVTANITANNANATANGHNTSITNLGNNDTTDRAYVNTTFIKIVNATTCTGTDKSVWNGTNFICSTDQTGGASGTSFTKYNRTTTDTKFGNLTVYNNTMTISLTGSKTISGECLLLVNSSVTTALPNLYLNITGNATGTTNLYYDTIVFTSATASTTAFSTVQNTTLNPTAVLVTPLPYKINWWVNESASGGNFTIAMRSSVTAGSIVTLNRGSYCRSIEQ